MVRRPTPRIVVVGADLDFTDIRMLLQKGRQGYRLLERAGIESLFGRVDPTQRQSVFVPCLFQTQMGEHLNGGFVNSHPSAFTFRLQTEAVPLVAAGHLGPKTLGGIGERPTQECILRHTVFVPAHKHSIVEPGALVQDTGSDAIADDLAVDPPVQQVGKHSSVVRCRFRQGKSFRPGHLLWYRGRVNHCRGLIQQKQDCFCEPHSLYMDEIIQRTLSADIPAFPMPEAGLAADLEAVVTAQLELTPTLAGHDIVRPVLQQKINGTDLLRCVDLLFGHPRHTASPLIPRHPAVPWPYRCAPRQNRGGQSGHRPPCGRRWA